MDIDAIRQWKDNLVKRMGEGAERCLAQKAMREKKLQAEYDSLVQEIAAEEELLKSKTEELEKKIASLADEEAKIKRKVTEAKAEKEKLVKKKEELSKVGKEAKDYLRVIGSTVLSGLGVKCKDQPGKILCPEGKICGSENADEIECNFWDCPLLKDPLKEHTMMSVASTATSTVLQQTNNTTTTGVTFQKN